MSFHFKETGIKDVWVIEPDIFGDERGFFMETYQKNLFDAAGLHYDFVQSNASKSHKGVLRGLHFQTRKPQAKLVRAVEGEVYDVAVDLRKGSPTYGKYVGVLLSAKKGNMFLIPRGFAHGFAVLSETAIFEYQCDDYYDPGNEGGIIWNDSDIAIQWPIQDTPILSEKDKHHPCLRDARVEFGMKDGQLQVL